ncbi:hypothetical protein [Halosimplex salinum]|uniref:hypothetical protein n=1 Tax=Halosimplex salinum TaxID=1710538 RepID=UPI000F4A382C|nr:hypothetical protein [Halosimplex salinum]
MISEVVWLLGMVVLVCLPGLCFVALFRLIDYVANDELIARVENGELRSGSPTRREAAGRADRAPSRSPPPDERVVCRACDAENWDHASYCWNCLAELS